MVLEGWQIDRYRILQLIGSGAMGDVYLAEDSRIGQQVAIKVIRVEPGLYPDRFNTEEAAHLFQREAQAIVKLDSPRILPLFDYGEELVKEASTASTVIVQDQVPISVSQPAVMIPSEPDTDKPLLLSSVTERAKLAHQTLPKSGRNGPPLFGCFYVDT